MQFKEEITINHDEMIEIMLEMQRGLDKAIYNEHGVAFDKEKCKLAMIDEIGEFNHEIKASWCWWKKTQKEIDREKALEELVDIWHFALSLTYHFYDELEKEKKYTRGAMGDFDLSFLYEMLIRSDFMKLETLEAIGKKFEFTIEDVFGAYIKKNRVNYERLAKGY